MIAHQPSVENKKIRLLIGSAAVVLGLGVGLMVTMVPNTTKLLVLIVGLAAAAATMWRVEWGLYALIFMGYTRFSDVMVRNGAPSTAQAARVFLIASPSCAAAALSSSRNRTNSVSQAANSGCRSW